MKKSIVICLLMLQFSLQVLEAQTTSIPDSNFEKALIDLEIDSDNTINGRVLTSDINSITDLNVFNRNIKSLAGIEGFNNLQTLNCSSNRLESIDLARNLKLKELSCASNLMTTLNTQANTELEKLNCQGNFITNLDISGNRRLRNVDFSSNRIKNINTSQNDSLISLKGSNNQLSSLALGSNTKLEELAFSNNQLSALNISNNKFLRTLLAASNQLAALSLIETDSLNFLDVSNNQLKALDLRNNRILTNLSIAKNQLSTLDLSKNDSLTFLGISNNQLKSLDISTNKKLTNLACASNQLNQINLDSNLYLQSIDVSLNLISGLNIEANDSLTSIDVSKNQLTSLNLQNGYNSKIETLNATSNPQLLCILIDDGSAIGQNWHKDETAAFNETCNALTYVPDDNFEQVLIDLGLDNSLDNYVLTANINTIQVLNLSGKAIKVLTGIKHFSSLASLNCANNSLSNLDVSGMTNLAALNCSSNSLVDLNLKNTIATLTTLDATLNLNLTCIMVDDVAAANNKSSWLKDAGASYSLNCNLNKTYVPDDNFEQALIDLGYDKGSPDDYVRTDSIHHIRILDISARNISDLRGIESFVLLDSLNCSSNNLTSIDVSKLDSLRKLSCFSNYLTSLDVTNNDSLLQFNCGNNRITSLDVTKNTKLLQLICDANDLTQIDVSKNPNLLSLNCASNYITTDGLDLNNNTYLNQLICANNKLTGIDISKNTLLANLDCASNYLSNLDISANAFLIKLNCSINNLNSIATSSNSYLSEIDCNSNQIENLDFSSNPNLWYISSDNNQLTNIDIRRNNLLRILSVASNRLTNLDITLNPLLNYLKCDENQLPGLAVNSNDSIFYLSLAGNTIENLVIGNLKQLTYLNCNRNNIEVLVLSTNTELLELSCSANTLQNLALDSNKKIQKLDISKNSITQIVLSQLDSLKQFICANNQLASLALNNNKVLQSFNCSGNKLGRLNLQNGNNDSLAEFNVTNNPELTCIEVDDPNLVGSNWQKDATASYSLNCHYNDTYIPDDNFEAALAAITGEANNNDNYILTSTIQTLASLDISNKNITDLTGIAAMASLQILKADHNNIEILDLGKNINLLNLNIAFNNLDSLDLNRNKELEILDISSNQIKQFKTDSLVALKGLNAAFNQLTDLNLRKNSVLQSLNCASNQLTSLRINNGNNSSLTGFDATQNPGLSCIEVDDPNSIGVGWRKDNTASYSKNCHYNEVYVPDDAFEHALIVAGYDYSGVDSLDNYIPIQKIVITTNLNISNKNIVDLTGLEAFVNLVSLDVSNNIISEIDLSQNQKLEKFYCVGNLLKSLDINLNVLLKDIDCSSNLLDTVNTSANLALNELNVRMNPVKIMDLQNNTSLKVLDCSYTNLDSLVLDKNIALEKMTATNNQHLFSINIQNGNNIKLKNINLQSNPYLTCILVDDRDFAQNNPGWLKDSTAAYRLICDDDDNDGVPDINDQCPATPPDDFVDLFGCSVFLLPPSNFTIIKTDEICRSSNNGKIKITAEKLYNYTATLVTDSVSKEFNFTNGVEIRDLRAGTYRLCITIKDKPGFSSCYDIVIKEPVDLAVLTKIEMEGEVVSLQLSGGTNYHIELNGKSFNTSATSITLALQQGINTLIIKADKECLGIYKNTIIIPGKLLYFPNPFMDRFTILIKGDNSREVIVNLYDITGKQVMSKLQPIQNGTVNVDASFLSSGIYTASIQSRVAIHTFKIIKK